MSRFTVLEARALYGKFFDPRPQPKPPPIAGVFDSPLLQICVNASWYSHIIGVLDLLTYEDKWTGTDDEKRAAVSAIEALIASAQEGCSTVPTQDFDMRWDETNCRIEWTINGVDWIPLSGMSPAPICLRGADGHDGENGAPGQDGQDGAPGQDGKDGAGWGAPTGGGENVPTRDLMCGSATKIATRFHESMHELIDDFEAGATVAQTILEILAVLEPTWFGEDIVELLQDLQEATFAIWRSAIDATWRDDLRCAIFCRIADVVEPEQRKWDESDNLYIQGWINTNTDFQVAIQCGLFWFFWFEAQKYYFWVGSNDSNNDCDQECDECPEDTTWCYTFDFTATNGGFTVKNPNAGHWVSGQGWVADNYAGAIYGISIERSFAQANITEVTIEGTRPGGQTYGNRLTLKLNGVNQYVNLQNVGSGVWSLTRTMDVGADHIAVEYPDSDQSYLYTRLTLKGEGQNPFGIDNCS